MGGVLARLFILLPLFVWAVYKLFVTALKIKLNILKLVFYFILFIIIVGLFSAI